MFFPNSSIFHKNNVGRSEKVQSSIDARCILLAFMAMKVTHFSIFNRKLCDGYAKNTHFCRYGAKSVRLANMAALSYSSP